MLKEPHILFVGINH